MNREALFTQEGTIEIARCVFCGNVVDPVVAENRSRSKASLAAMLDREAREDPEVFCGTNSHSFSRAPSRRAA